MVIVKPQSSFRLTVPSFKIASKIQAVSFFVSKVHGHYTNHAQDGHEHPFGIAALSCVECLLEGPRLHTHVVASHALRTGL